MKLAAAESTSNMSSSQLICFGCLLCHCWLKKTHRPIEYCSFHSNRDSDGEWVGVGGRVAGAVERENDRECETKTVTEVRMELSVYASEDKKREWRTETRKRNGMFSLFSL